MDHPTAPDIGTVAAMVPMMDIITPLELSLAAKSFRIGRRSSTVSM